MGSHHRDSETVRREKVPRAQAFAAATGAAGGSSAAVHDARGPRIALVVRMLRDPFGVQVSQVELAVHMSPAALGARKLRVETVVRILGAVSAAHMPRAALEVHICQTVFGVRVFQADLGARLAQDAVDAAAFSDSGLDMAAFAGIAFDTAAAPDSARSCTALHNVPHIRRCSLDLHHSRHMAPPGRTRPAVAAVRNH